MNGLFLFHHPLLKNDGENGSLTVHRFEAVEINNAATNRFVFINGVLINN